MKYINEKRESMSNEIKEIVIELNNGEIIFYENARLRIINLSAILKYIRELERYDTVEEITRIEMNFIDDNIVISNENGLTETEIIENEEIKALNYKEIIDDEYYKKLFYMKVYLKDGTMYEKYYDNMGNVEWEEIED